MTDGDSYLGLQDAVRQDRRTALIAIRDRLAAELEAAEGRDAAMIAKELRAVVAEIDGLPSGRVESRLDQLAAAVGDELAGRRARRRTDATGS